jgi:hypothetical protein
MFYQGMPIVTSLMHTVPAQDWSRVRSPSRAIRRMRRGFAQNIRHWQAPSPEIFVVGGTIHCHPVTLHKLQQRLQEDASHL